MLQLCVVHVVFLQFNQPLSAVNHNLVTVRMKPDENGRFGFNVKVCLCINLLICVLCNLCMCKMKQRFVIVVAFVCKGKGKARYLI